MLRIVALNEQCSDGEGESLVAVTREAQETIAESEYVRAIKFKSQGEPENALTLLEQLLETKVLTEIASDDINDKLWAIRYNCHKNLAMIYEEKDNLEAALQHYISAVQIDDTDVYTIHRFGQLALKNNEFELAEYAFEKCLRCNPHHWGATDGLLHTFFRNQNILGAYGLAIKLHRRDANYKPATDVIVQIVNTFKCLIPFFEEFWGSLPEDLAERKIASSDNELFNRKPEKKVFMVKSEKQPPEREKNYIQQFRIKSGDCVSLGQYITSIYKYLEQSGLNMFFPLNLGDIIAINNVNEPEEINKESGVTRNEECPTTDAQIENGIAAEYKASLPGGANDSDHEYELNEGSNSATWSLPATDPPKNAITNCNDFENLNKTEASEAAKPKPRRRCSDLHFLEQWGWHKSRRYNSRKKSQPDRVEVDNSLNGILRKIFAKHFSLTFDTSWPFSVVETSEAIAKSDHKFDCIECAARQKTTQPHFEEFLNKLENKTFDLMFLIYEWLKYVLKLQNEAFSENLKKTYLDIFSLYVKHFDFPSWNQMSNKTLKTCCDIYLLFLELQYGNLASGDAEMLSEWKGIFNKLMFHLGWSYVVFEDENYDEYQLRLINIENLWHSLHNDLEKCVQCLQKMKEIMITKNEQFVLHLPNLNSSCITNKFLNEKETELKRRISLEKIPALFEAKMWPDVSRILKENIEHACEKLESDDWTNNFRIQIEMLLQSLLSMGANEECLIWAEKFLHYSTIQYLKSNMNSSAQKLWSESINYECSYIETLIITEGIGIVTWLNEKISRLVQNITCLLSSQLDTSLDNKSCPISKQDFDMRRLWVILHQIMLKDESCSLAPVKSKSGDNDDVDEVIPHSFLVLFTAHEFLGKRQWCTKGNGGLLHYILDMVVPNLRAPLYDQCRDSVYEYLEQVTYCLYGYPQKKARSRHLEDHEAVQVELSWSKAVQMFDLYRPEQLPEFNSYKLESITTDMEQFFLKIVALMPNDLDPIPATVRISEFISGNIESCHGETLPFELPYKINNIFYLLADYYFKNRDFSKAIKYYTLDLAGNSNRFDSWAGMALSKASKIETKLNGLSSLVPTALLEECEDVIRCFEMCISLNRKQTLLWIEYGSFTYIIHSSCSRHLKQSAEQLTDDQITLLQDRKIRMLNIAYNCFSLATTLLSSVVENDDVESHEERWLCQYMLGKIAEKRKEHPKVYLNFYLTAANYLYESNASYPIKINHSNPTTLSVEALEVFYRINASIIKYLERENEISRDIGSLFHNVLKSLASSPFAFNKAKIDGNSINALKRKIAAEKCEQVRATKVSKIQNENQENVISETRNDENAQSKIVLHDEIIPHLIAPNPNDFDNPVRMDGEPAITTPTRRESQESTVTGTTTTVTSSTTSLSSSSESSSDSESDSEESSLSSDPKKPFTASEQENLYTTAIRNLEECATRFPEHYKSLYRLVYHYMNAPESMQDLRRCEQLLLDQYKTSLENQINGLFFDRKNNNLFNGIWRIPSSEIDRPGSFSAHLVKCAGILIELLIKRDNHRLLIDVALQMYKTPDQDKRYIKDVERMELYQRSITGCAQILRKIFNVHAESRNDAELLNLMIDIYRIHKKCVKYMNHKEHVFTQVLIDVYKFYIQDKIDYIPENLNYLDLAIKLCLQEISIRKTTEKMMNTSASDSTLTTRGIAAFSNALTRPVQIPGLTIRNRGRSSFGKTAAISSGTSTLLSMSNIQAPLPSTSTDIYVSNNSTVPLTSMSIPQYESIGFEQLMDYYKTLLSQKQTNQQLPMTSIPLTSIGAPGNSTYLASSLPAETTITQARLPDQVLSRITNCDITITPAFTKSNAYLPADLTKSTSVGTNASLTKSTTDIDLKPITSQATAVSLGSTAGLFMKPISTNFQTETKLHSSTSDFASIVSLPITSSSESSGHNILVKKMHKAQEIYMTPISKPFAVGQINVESSSKPATILPSPFNIENYTQHMKLLSTYADLIKNTTLQQQKQQFPMPSQRSRALAKRKPKQPKSEVNVFTSSTIDTQSMGSTVAKITQAQSQQSRSVQQQSTHQTPQIPNHFCYPIFDPNTISMTPVSTTVVSQLSNQMTMPSSLSSFQSLTNAYTQNPQNNTISNSPTKTLQQKLAERKKAHKSSEMNSAQGNSDEKPNIDVIILD